MAPQYPALSRHLDEAGVDGYAVDADGEDSTQRYLSGFHALGNVFTLYAEGTVRLLVPNLELERAREESDADAVHSLAAYDYGNKVMEYGESKARSFAIAEFLADHDIDAVSVPLDFPTGTADVLREEGVRVEADYAQTVETIRAVKSDVEVETIAAVQAANEDAMAAVESMLERATVEDDVLHLDGAVLTSERVRLRIEDVLRNQGCSLDDCVVASGAESAKSHAAGSGPIRTGEPLVVDVFPRDEDTRYVGDMTRTFVKGTPSDQVREWYDVTRDAFRTALDAIEPGVTGEAVNDAVCDVVEAAGYQTLRTDESIQDGFTHPTGHGVGLDLHELPKLSWGHGELEPGNVVTVEPGLYEQGTGGVRLEDAVVVTEDGYECLNDYPRDLRVV